MLLHTSRIGLLMAILSLPDIVRFASRAYRQWNDKDDSHLIQYSVRTTFCLTVAVLPYLSCVKKRVGMHTCETFWVVIMLLAVAGILIGESGRAKSACS
eukprot:7221885-Heterocapsa_arctica.AAC.1